jgi:hypothetical protein
VLLGNINETQADKLEKLKVKKFQQQCTAKLKKLIA